MCNDGGLCYTHTHASRARGICARRTTRRKRGGKRLKRTALDFVGDGMREDRGGKAIGSLEEVFGKLRAAHR